MPSATAVSQIAFRYRPTDSVAGLTRKTAQRLARHLGMDETQTIHRALRELAVRELPQYEADDGPLSTKQLAQISKRAKTGPRKNLRSTLFDNLTAK
jgi:hypothetical protein